jgi:hypothetical protein
MASGSAYDGDDSPPIEDHDPDSPDTVLVTSANIMRFPTMNMDGTAPLPSAPARGELAHAQTPSAPVPNVGAGVPEPINLRRFCELLQVGSALRAPCASDDAHGFARPAHPTMPTALALRVRGMQPSSTTVQRQRQLQALGACLGAARAPERPSARKLAHVEDTMRVYARGLSIRLPAPALPRLRLLASAASRSGMRRAKFGANTRSFIHNADLGPHLGPPLPALGCCD